MQRLDRSDRGGARRVRPGTDLVRGDAASVLGEPQPHRRHASGQRRGYAVPVGDYWANDAQRELAETSKAAYGERLAAAGYPAITTEIAHAGPFYYAEDYHQQYLHKNPYGYCPDHSTGVSCPVGLDLSSPPAQTDALPPETAPAA